MLYIDINEKNQNLLVKIPLTNGTGKSRIKKRSILNEYGYPVATKRENFSQSCYVEWQIGYDVAISDSEKLKLTSIKNLNFTGANGKQKTLYELSEYIYYFHKWNIIKKDDLLNIKNYLLNIKDEDLIENNENYTINRSSPIPKNVCDLNFNFIKVEYPMLVYKFKNYEIIAEIIVKEKQYAIGTQPMLYFCFPITELKSDENLLGRTAKTKEIADFIIDKNNIFVFLEMLKIFGILSLNHKKDILNIVDLIIK